MKIQSIQSEKQIFTGTLLLLYRNMIPVNGKYLQILNEILSEFAILISMGQVHILYP